MKIEAGVRYVTRDGDVTSPLRIETAPIAGQIWTAEIRGIDRNWSRDGSWAPPHQFGLDLVKSAPTK